jgi:hypothetical protein
VTKCTTLFLVLFFFFLVHIQFNSHEQALALGISD